MKHTPNLFLALVASFLIATSATRAADYYWDPNHYNSTNADPNGKWTAVSLSFWDGSGRAGDSSFASGVTNLYFNVAGNITKDDISQLTTGSTYNFYFASGTTNITSGTSGAVAGIQTGDASAYINLQTDTVLNFAGSGSTLFRIGSGKSSSGGDNLVFQGGGTVNFNNGSYISPYNGNSQTIIKENTTVNFNLGSGFYGNGGSASAPLQTQMGRLAVNGGGTLNVNGGNLYLAYTGAANNLGRSWGLGIGMSVGTAPAVVNIHSGSITALGEVRAGGDIPVARRAGVAFGNDDSGTAGVGGILNLYGGSLITTNIRADSSATYAVLNLDGGTLMVTTDDNPDQDSSVTAEQRQRRLNYFINGFAGTENHRVVIGNNGVTIDTSGIDPTRVTSAVATIQSAMFGSGNITKTGEHTLLVSGNQYYTGATIISGGTLAVGNLAGTENNDSIKRSSMILVKNGAVFDSTRRSVAYQLGLSSNQQVLTNEGTGKVVGNIDVSHGIIKAQGTFVIEGNVTSLADTSVFQFGNLGTDILSITGSLDLASGVIIDLSEATLSLETYDLFFADSISYSDISVAGAGSGYQFDFNVNTSGSQQVLQMTVTAIPEPSTYALVMLMATMAFLVCRRKK